MDEIKNENLADGIVPCRWKIGFWRSGRYFRVLALGRFGKSSWKFLCFFVDFFRCDVMNISFRDLYAKRFFDIHSCLIYKKVAL